MTKSGFEFIFPEDNPFVKQPGALPEIWSVGHRNIQSATFDDAGRLWTIEHGAQGGDELNLIEKGKNYGWAEISHKMRREGMETPLVQYSPALAPASPG